MTLKSIDALTLKTWIDHNEALLIDVREPAEHEALRIRDAHPLPVGQVTLKALPERDHRLLVVHCLKGARGDRAAQILKSQGFPDDIYNLEGGIAAWEAAGLPLIRPKTRSRLLPLDRQVQLILGLGLVLSGVLALTVNPLIAVVPVLLGGGLTFAGSTGICGLAKLLALMPWNRVA